MEHVDAYLLNTINLCVMPACAVESCGWPVYHKEHNTKIVLKYEPDPIPHPDSPSPALPTWVISVDEHCLAKVGVHFVVLYVVCGVIFV